MASPIMTFIEENYRDLLAFAVKLNGNWADGEDVLQTVAMKLCLMQDEIKEIAHCKSYLMVCIRNASINLMREKWKRRVVDTDFEVMKEVVPDSKSERDFEVVEWINALEQNLNCYDEASRKAFIAYYVDQAPLEKVAASMGLTKRQAIKRFESMRNYLKRHHKHLFVQLSILLSM